MATEPLDGSVTAGQIGPLSVAGAHMGAVAKWLRRRTQRELRCSAVRVRLPVVAALLLALTVVLTSTGAGFCNMPAPPTAARGTGYSPLLLLPRQQKRPLSIKPSWCGLLLASCIMSGDVELNPGPRPHHANRDITLISQNVQSLKNKLGDLRLSAPELMRFSVVAMTESWLNDSVTTDELEAALPSHSLLRRDRANRVGGGVACFVRSELKPERRQDLEPADAEMLAVELKTSPPLVIAVCYCPPDDAPALSHVMSALERITTSAPGKPLVVTGDFNVPELTWSSTEAGGADPAMTRHTRRAAVLFDGCHLAGLTQHVTEPSRGQNYLDLVFSNGQTIVATVRDGIFPSDHREVVCDIRTVRGRIPLVSRAKALNYKRADWDGLRTALRLLPWNTLDNLPVDDAAALFYDLLNSAIADHIPLVCLKCRRPPWFDGELRRALAEKEAAHRGMKCNRTPDTEALFSDKRREFKRLSRSKFHLYLKDLTDDLGTNPKRFWTFLRNVKGKSSEIPPLVNGSEKVETDVQKAELLNCVFASKFSDPSVAHVPRAPVYDIDPIQSFHVSEESVRSVLKGVNPGKACGPDNVSARVVRECADELTVPITTLCRLSLEQGSFPKAWKQANIVPIHKKGPKSSPQNYRSVSLLPLFGKVLERVVYATLYEHVKPALSEKQHGFLPGRSCVSNLLTMLNTAWDNISTGSQTDVIYTDFSSAFQSVNHGLLLHKLQNSYHLSGNALAWCKSYLSDREQRVVINGKCSQWTPVLSGTPEGGLLSSLLFVMYINDLPDSVKTDCVMFADDVKLYTRIGSAADCDFLQRQLDNLQRWSRLWQLKLNPSKCKVMTLTLRRAPITGTFTVDGEQLERVKVMRDLGVFLDEKLTFAEHVNATVSKATRALGMLMRAFQTGKHGMSLRIMNKKAMLAAYCSNVRSILEYGGVVWGGAAEVHMKRIERVQHKFLMWLSGRRREQVSFEYDALLDHFSMATLAARRDIQDIMLIRSIHCHKIDSSFLLEKFPLAVPSRSLRSRTLFYVPRARVNTVKNSPFSRIPQMCNAFLEHSRCTDVWNETAASFKQQVMAYVRNV